MPAGTKHDAIARQWEMLKLVAKSVDGLTYKQIRESLAEAGYDVTKRTVERDLHKLAPVLGLEYEETEDDDIDEKDPYVRHKWTWATERQVGLGGISTEEALSLRLVEQTVKDQVPWSVLHVLKPRFAQAKAKLEGISTRNNKARWLDKVASIPRNLTLIPPQYSQETLDTVQTALLEERELHIAYKSLQDKTPRPRDVHPRALLQKGPVTYLIANKANDTTPRLYAIHRISEAYRTGRPVGRSPFNLKNYLVEQAHEVGTGEWLDLELWVSVNLAKILKETPLAKGQTLTEVDDGARVQARIKDTLPLRQWIRGHGPAVEVLGPAGLRQTVAADLRTAADRYSKPSRRKPSQAA